MNAEHFADALIFAGLWVGAPLSVFFILLIILVERRRKRAESEAKDAFLRYP